MLERKIGRGRAEITCKNNNGLEYHITRPPAFLPFIGSRIRERKKERDKRMREKEREEERYEDKTEIEERSLKECERTL